MATNTDGLLPWVSGQWRLAESEVAWLRQVTWNGQPALHLRLSVACWRPDARQAWRYWPGVAAMFVLPAASAASPGLAGLGDAVGRLSHGDFKPMDHGVAQGCVPLDGPGGPSSWTLHWQHGTTLQWSCLRWAAHVDPGRMPMDWLHC